MAFINEAMCYECKKVTTHTNNYCNICTEKNEKERIRIWNAQSTKHKLDDLRRRIEKLEKGPALY